MKDVGAGEQTPPEESASDAEAHEGEHESLLASGPNSGKRAGAFGLLALIAIIGAAVCYHLSGSGGNSFLSRLDNDLLTHAELTLASREGGGRLTVVPSWPLRLYATLRDDIIFYAGAAAVAAWLWALSAKARARRDAFLVHEDLTKQLNEVRKRVEELEGKSKLN